jgi:hypothetical protein
VATSVKLFIVGGLLVLAGLGVGFWPLSSGMQLIGCGSGFGRVSSDSVAVQQGAGLDEQCATQRGRMRLVAVGLLVVGGLVGAAGVGGRFASGRAKSPVTPGSGDA